MSKCTKQVVAFFSACLVASAVSVVMGASGDWPQWRGPKRDNISTETGLLKSWPKGGPHLDRKISGLGKGFSDVAIAQGKIFTMGDREDGAYVEAFSLEGQPAWATKIGPKGGGGGFLGTRSTPTVDGSNIFALGQFGDLVCLQSSDGHDVWHVNLEKDLGGQAPGWSYTESPTVDGKMVLCTPGGEKGTVAALDKTNGKVLWRSTDLKDGAAYCSLVPADILGKHQYVVLTAAHVAGIGAEGAVLWKVARHGETAVIPTPIVSNNLVFVTSGYDIGCNLFRIEKSGDAMTAKQVYKNRNMIVHHGGVVLVDGYVYGTSDHNRGSLVCMELATGKEKWSNQSVGKGSIVYADGHLYVRSENGPAALVEATPNGYHETGRFDQPDRSSAQSWPHPVIAGGKLYLRDEDNLFVYDVRPAQAKAGQTDGSALAAVSPSSRANPGAAR